MPRRAWIAALAAVVSLAAAGASAASRSPDATPGTSADVNGSYQFVVHVQAGVTVVGVLSISSSGGKLSGSVSNGSETAGVTGTIRGTKVKFDEHGKQGYVAHFTGTATCDGAEMHGGWIDVAAEGGSWDAKRQTAGIRAAAAAPGSGGVDRGGAHTAGCSASLKVAVSGAGKLTAGLAYDGNEPAFVTHQRCVSGCADLLVTVTRGGQAVSNATVSASVSPVGDRFLTRSTKGYLCAVATPSDCSNFLTGLRTNAGGRLRLRYWAPGLLSKQTATVTVKATAAGKEAKPADHRLTVVPNLIYDHPGKLTLQEARDLAGWTQGTLLNFSISKGAELSIDRAITFLIASEHAAEKVLSAFEKVTGVLEIVHLTLEEHEQIGWLALFAEQFHLSALGLGLPPDASHVNAAPSREFIDAFAGDVRPPLHLGPKGLLWKYGEDLALVRDRGELTGEQFLHLYVYEVSTCAQGMPCGPYYHGQGGIRPELYLELVSRKADLTGTITKVAVVRYNAAAWMDTQEGVRVQKTPLG